MEVNPFTYGNPISDPGRFFGRQAEVIQIFSRLCNAEFESSSLIGERRVGKTSLINYLRDERICHSFGLSSDKYIFIYLNLYAVTGEITPVRLWQWLIQEMATCCRDIAVRPLLEEITRTASIDSLMLTNLFSTIGKKGQFVG